MVRAGLRLPPDLKALVDNLAVAKHRSRNAQLVRLIEIGLAVSTASSPAAAAERAHETEQQP
jgi:predicted transcriptional regulator